MQRTVKLVLSRAQNDLLIIPSSLFALFMLIQIWLLICSHGSVVTFFVVVLHSVVSSVLYVAVEIEGDKIGHFSQVELGERN